MEDTEGSHPEPKHGSWSAKLRSLIRPIGRAKKEKPPTAFGSEVNSVGIEPPSEIREPRAEVLLGSVDPKSLTREQFLHSPDLLYHGTGKEFVFDPTWDIFVDDVKKNRPTVGAGFYTTDNPKEAKMYSRARVPDTNKPSVVVAVLPYQAKMFDFRAISDIRTNGHVPAAMIKEYAEYYQEWLNSHAEDNSKDEPNLVERIRHDIMLTLYNYYSQTLKRIVALNSPFELRAMLGTTGKVGEVIIPVANIFTTFMLSKGYDGIIYIEGGDNPGQNNPTSFVFYNLSKIGSYESWH